MLEQSWTQGCSAANLHNGGCIRHADRLPSPARPQTSPSPAQAEAAASALSPDEWRSFKLVHKEALTKGVANPTVRVQGSL